MKCTQLVVEHQNSLSRLREADRQLASARREELEMEAYIRNSARDKAKYILKSEHESQLRAREDELVTDMRKQLANGHANMRKRTAEAVELSHAEHRKEVTRLEQDRQHFVSAPAESMKSPGCALST